MALLSRSELGRLCRAAEPSDLLGFIADLYAVRGWTVETTDPNDAVVTLKRDGSLQRLGVVTETPVPDGVDTVVIVGADIDSASITADRYLDVGDLRNLLLYGIDREQAATVFERWFDQPLSAFDRPSRPVESTAASRGDTEQDSTSGPGPGHPAPTAIHAEKSPEARSKPPSGGGLEATSSPFLHPRYIGLAFGLLLAVGIGLGTAGISLPATDAPLDGDQPADPRVTPVPTPTPSTTFQGTGESDQPVSAQPTQIPAQATAFPPGVNRTGIIDYRKLIAAHESQLEGQSYRITLSYRELKDGTVSGGRTQTVRVENRTTYRVTSTEFGRVVSLSPSLGSGDVYANSSAEFERSATGVTRRPPQGADSFRRSLSRYLGWYLSVSESQVVSAAGEGGTSTVRVTTDGDPYPGVTNATGTAIVSESGLVTHLYRTHETPDSPVRIVITIRVSDVSTTTVSTPEWARDA